MSDAHTFWELLEARTADRPDAVVLLDEADRRLTFGDLHTQALACAAGLADLGVQAGTPVSWQLPTRIETLVLSLALARLGAVQNPVIPLYREREVAFLLAETAAALYVVPGTWRGRDFAAMGHELCAGAGGPRLLVCDDGLPAGDPSVLPPFVPAPDEVRWVYYTSGTTSRPKGVRHTDATLLAGSRGLVDAHAITPADVGSIAFPVAHIGGPHYLGTLLQVGFPAVLVEQFVPADALAVYRRHGVTMVGGGPAFYAAFLAEQRRAPGEPILPSLRLMSGGAAPKPPQLWRDVHAEVGVRIYHGFGMTESPCITMGATTDTDEQLTFTDGAAVTGMQVRVVDPSGADVPVGAEGEVALRGAALCKGYTDPALTAESFDADGWFHSGDLGRLRPDGHLTLTGRLKDVIIRKGENVSAREVEELLLAHPAVAEVAVIGLPDADRGERVCAVVQPAPDAPPPTLAALTEHLTAAGLMRQKHPEQLELVDELPRNALAKVLKTELRRRYA